MCSSYEPRTEEIKIINEVSQYYKNEKERLMHMQQYAAERLKELEENVKEYMEKHGTE